VNKAAFPSMGNALYCSYFLLGIPVPRENVSLELAFPFLFARINGIVNYS